MNGMDKPGRAPLPVLPAAFLWGSLWGLAEATVGYLLHIVRVPGLPGLIMLPVGLFMMGCACRRTGRIEVIPVTALVAALLKLAALPIPGIDVLAVVNPVRAILLESLVAAGLAAAFGRAAGLPAAIGPPLRSSASGRGGPR
jgi:hypothetical protein